MYSWAWGWWSRWHHASCCGDALDGACGFLKAENNRRFKRVSWKKNKKKWKNKIMSSPWTRWCKDGTAQALHHMVSEVAAETHVSTWSHCTVAFNMNFISDFLLNMCLCWKNKGSEIKGTQSVMFEHTVKDAFTNGLSLKHLDVKVQHPVQKLKLKPVIWSLLKVAYWLHPTYCMCQHYKCKQSRRASDENHSGFFLLFTCGFNVVC